MIRVDKMNKDIQGKYKVAIELIQETMNCMAVIGTSFEIISYLDLAMDLMEDIQETIKFECDLGNKFQKIDLFH